MLKARLFIFFIFFTSLAVASQSEWTVPEMNVYLLALAFYWIFSASYFHLRIHSKLGSSTIDYGITYSLSFGLFAGPAGLLIFETLYRFTVYFTKVKTKTADPDEFVHTFYNIGAFTLNNSIAYFIFQSLYPRMEGIPFGFWLLMLLLITVTAILSDLYLIIFFSFLGEINTRREAIDFIKSRSVLDMGKIAFTNGFLLLFLQQGKWDMLLGLFLLNYLVSRSFLSKSQSAQHKYERDKFEQMAYTDFLTGVHNRAFMDQKMKELDKAQETVGIIVADIDKFKLINDSYNHAVGDCVIRHFADCLKGVLTEEDVLIRSGGEEFTLFLRGRNFNQCSKLIEDINRGLLEKPAEADFHGKMIQIGYTASFGLYYGKVNTETPMEKAYILADQLLFQAKDLGRNRVSAKNGLVSLEAIGS
ncbi:GGDEF domain-containing protein [Bacillus infantis]|uniref:GGDEF domain-containing protein n=1 Tax=Bacillus infantis TaxID=324767 RepID=UPI000B9C686F|nr:GGDEF domain-containing protein [Bacillus infantis]MCK6207881.1 GGDEF domain-containing protein [Bacillus infantis]OXT17568.1 GGDEF domain-containing protein [Bacillus sp. OG2]